MWKSGHQNASVLQAGKYLWMQSTQQTRKQSGLETLEDMGATSNHWKVEGTQGAGATLIRWAIKTGLRIVTQLCKEPIWGGDRIYNYSQGSEQYFQLATDGLKRCGQYLRANFTKDYRRMWQACEFVEEHGDSKQL